MLSPKSRLKLNGVHNDLCRVVLRASDLCDFVVVEGVRTLEKQREYFQAGKSKTMKSRHLTGHAVDLAPLVDTDGDGDKELSWEMAHFLPIRAAMEVAGREYGVAVVWGGDWKSLVDCPHFELSREHYP